jgi:adenylate kinase family enzyme
MASRYTDRERSAGGVEVSEIDAALRIGRRVIVTGMAGAGKSTFARQLSAKTGLPVIHLDMHFWQPGWAQPSDKEWRDVQSTLLAGEAWIADGNYHETLDLRLARADTVVFLDTPWWLCAARAFMRGLRRPQGFQLPEGCETTVWRQLRDEWWLVWRVWLGRRSERERELAIVAQHGGHATLHVLRSKNAVRAFLDHV